MIVDLATPRAPAPLDEVSRMRTVRWVAVLFALGVLLQRFSVPGSVVPLLLPIVLGWLGLAMARGVVELDRTRLMLLCAAVAVTGAAIFVQPLLVPAPRVSLTSWGLVFAVSSTLVFRLVDRRPETFQGVLHAVSTIGVVQALGALTMTATQFAGIAYRDVFASVVPEPLQLSGYVITYPYAYGGTLFRANAWVGLEPSFVSFQLGLAALAAMMVRRSWLVLALILAGLASTASGSGILILLVGVAGLVSSRLRGQLRPRLLPLGLGILVLLSTPYGIGLAARAGEVAEDNSSASLRAIQPYERLLTPWLSDLPTMFFGAGPGTSQVLVTATSEAGLLVPTPIKILFDYGIIAGSVLAAFLITCYCGSLSPVLAFTLFFSLWTLQPGLTTILLVMHVVILVSLWPRDHRPEVDEHVPRSLAPTGASP